MIERLFDHPEAAMRWDSLRLTDEGDSPAPPLFGRAAVTRRFDTPEFRGMTFYEVQARSIINRVPEASRVPFRWTINPYRGCSHACVYCMAGDTSILMGDGTLRPLADIRRGDTVYGTVRVGAYRRYVLTEVLAHWQTVTPAYRVTLQDGTSLVSGGDHRFLTHRGWKYVTGTDHGAGRRPHLTTNDELLGFGSTPMRPETNEQYRLGYLCGLLRGDGHIGSYGYPRPGRSIPDVHRFRPALADNEALDRAQRYLAESGVPTNRFPAITRKRTIVGTAVKSNARLRVVSVEPLDIDLPMYDITTGTGDFIANGVISHNCFARNTHTYLDLDAGHDFDSKVVVKVNAPDLLRRELAAPSWSGEHIAMGTNVDCYQRAEGRYQLMRGILAALRDAGNPFSILTKGSLILRDLDLLTQAAAVTEVGAAVSVGFLDRELWRLVEPGTPSPQKRLEVCSRLTEAGIGCSVLMAPILPFLTDTPEQLEAGVRAAAAAGARSVTPIVLHLRPGAREWYLRWLGGYRPELLPAYEELYGTRAYAPKAYQRRIGDLVGELARAHGVGGSPRHRPAGARRAAGPAPPAPPAPPEAQQLTML